MHHRLARATLLSPLFVLAFAALGFAQGNFVYTNDDTIPNTVSGFSAAADGTLTPIPGSPFATGGNGNFGGYYGAARVAPTIVGNHLYASNRASNSVSAFTIDPATGVLTPVPGSPFALPGAQGGDISLAPTPDGAFLIVGQSVTASVSSYAIAADGSLTLVDGPVVVGDAFDLDSIRVSPDGDFVFVSLYGEKAIAVLSIGADGTLTEIAGSPFATPVADTDDGPAGMDVTCAGTRLYVGIATRDSTYVDGFAVAANGSLTPLPGSPYIFASGKNSNNVVLSPDERFLFVTNQDSNTVTALAVAADGSLSLVAGSPFSTGIPLDPGTITDPVGLATNAEGTLLYVANTNNTVSVFTIAANGTLTLAPGSPVSTGVQGGGLNSIAAYPVRECAFAPEVAIECAGNTTVAPQFLVGCTPSAQLTYDTPTATTNCPGGNVTVVCEPASGSVFPMGTTEVTCTATDDCGGSASCSFAVVVADPFAVPGGAVCLVGDTTGDTFSEVVAPGPLRGFWIYHVAATGEDICGIANKVSYQANRSLVSSDTNYSDENPSYYMDANVNFGTHSGTVTVSRKGTSRKYTLRDRDTRNDPGCATSGGGGGGGARH